MTTPGVPALTQLHALGLLAILAVAGLAFAERLPLTTAMLVTAPVLLAYISLRDRTHLRKRMELDGQLQKQAFYDDLTALPNRALFIDRLQHALDAARRDRSRVGVLFIDLDRLKLVNDSLGHNVGDQLLVTAAQRLLGVVRPGDTVARLGGDEFTILMTDIEREQEAVAVADRVLSVLSEPGRVAGHEVSVRASIGIVTTVPSGRGYSAADLLRDADVAMYSAKASGRGRHVIYRPEMNARAIERLDLEGDLRRAVESAGLTVYYQPEIDLRSRRVVAVEALARWNHPVRGFVPPSQFIELAEESGLILPLGRWVLAEACRQAVLWQAISPRPLAVSVNVAARQLQDPDFPAQIVEILQKARLDPSLLRLEVSERIALAETPTVVAALRRVKELGIRLAIDDFAAGHSSLSYLTELEVDVLKMDRSLIAGIDADRKRRSVVAALVGLSHDLALVPSAEGVETRSELEVLTDLGCDRAQGFFLSRPLADVNLGEMLAANEELEQVA